ncbi:MAG: helix-turn-helix transcriptional regulator [Vulcanimicrobiaceae bacterium]|jgi:transcriptional regulator with XRE-family HTH domain
MAANPSSSVRPNILQTIGENLLFERARARLSQAEVGERSGVARPTISRIENGAGDVGVGTLDRLAATLGISVARLFIERGLDTGPVDDDELIRRSNEPDSEFVDADDLFAALADAERHGLRYSNAGRPPARSMGAKSRKGR